MPPPGSAPVLNFPNPVCVDRQEKKEVSRNRMNCTYRGAGKNEIFLQLETLIVIMFLQILHDPQESSSNPQGRRIAY